jgi:hypothetical protein
MTFVDFEGAFQSVRDRSIASTPLGLDQVNVLLLCIIIIAEPQHRREYDAAWEPGHIGVVASSMTPLAA